MREINKDQLTVAVEAAQCGPGAVLGIMYRGSLARDKPLRVNPRCARDFGVWAPDNIAHLYVMLESETADAGGCMCGASRECYEVPDAPDRN